MWCRTVFGMTTSIVVFGAVSHFAVGCHWPSLSSFGSEGRAVLNDQQLNADVKIQWLQFPLTATR